MSLLSVTARCVHCTWRTDVTGGALAEQRDVHELMHPGGTVLVGGDPGESGTPRTNPARVANRRSAVERIRAIHDRPIEEDATQELGTCTKTGCARPAVERRKVGRGHASYCQDHLDAWLAQKITRGKKREAVPPPAPKAKGHSEGRKPAEVTRKAAPAQAASDPQEGTLVELAQVVEEARERYNEAQRSLFAATVALADALRAALAALPQEAVHE